jgi:hypothetical protein
MGTHTGMCDKNLNKFFLCLCTDVDKGYQLFRSDTRYLFHIES